MKKQRKELRLQMHQFSIMTSEPITAIRLLDKKEVTLLTTAHQPLEIMYVKNTQKDRSRVEVLCPKAITSYVMSMGRMDLFDHYTRRSSYSINKKSQNFCFVWCIHHQFIHNVQCNTRRKAKNSRTDFVQCPPRLRARSSCRMQIFI